MKSYLNIYYHNGLRNSTYIRGESGKKTGSRQCGKPVCEIKLIPKETEKKNSDILVCVFFVKVMKSSVKIILVVF